MPKKNAQLDHIVFYVNTICNAHCVMCDVGRSSKTGIARPLTGAPKYMDLGLMEKVLNDPLLADRDVKVNAYFIMTEPLLTPHLPALMKAAYDRGHPIYLTTNGLLLEKRAEEIAPYLTNIQVSLDGPEEVHDSIRGKNFFSSALRGLRAIRALRPDLEIVINTTIFNRTAPYIYKLGTILDGLGIRIDLYKVQGLDFVSDTMSEAHNVVCGEIPQTTSTEGGVLDFDSIDYEGLADQLEKLRNWKSRNITEVGFKPFFNSVEELKEFYSVRGRRIPRCGTCVTPWGAMAVNTNGDCFPHIRCFNDFVLGNVATQSLHEVFYGERVDLLRRKLAENNYCLPACTRCCGVTPVEKVNVSI